MKKNVGWNRMRECLCALNKLPNKCAAVISPMFNDENITDGYFQRIQAIDQIVLPDFFRIYIKIQEDYTAPIRESQFKILLHDSRMEVSLDIRVKWQEWFLKKLIRKCAVAYIHCALRMIERSTGAAIRQALTQGRVRIVWDVHGAVPEEFLMYQDVWGAQEARESETFLARNADVIVVVNEHMKRHLQSLYGEQIRGMFVTLPIFNLDIEKQLYSDADKAIRAGEKMTVVYAGGLQRWQCIEEMQDAIERFGNRANYEMCVPETERFMELWENRKTPEVLNVSEKNHEELFCCYQKCHLGFVLRKKSVVNEVACPTKLIEYIQHGIIPIMDSPEVGDFVELGMQYIPVDDFNDGIVPPIQQLEKMAKLNLMVLKKLSLQHEEGIRQIKELLGEKKREKIAPLMVEKNHKAYVLRGEENDEKLEEILSTGTGAYLIIESLRCVANTEKLENCTVFCTSGIRIKDRKFGGNREEFSKFCEKYGIYSLQDNERKVTPEQFADEIYGD